MLLRDGRKLSTAQTEFPALPTKLYHVEEENLNLTSQINLLRAQALPVEEPINPEKT